MSKMTDIGLELFRQAFMGGSVSTVQVPGEDYKATQRALRDLVARGLLEPGAGDTKHRRYRVASAIREVQARSNLGVERKMFLCHAIYHADEKALETFRIDTGALLKILFDDSLPTHFYSLSDYGEKSRADALLRAHGKIAEAVAGSHGLKLSYQKADGTAKQYELHPYAILVERYWDYLLAVDVNETRRSPLKTFRLDRIRQAVPLKADTFEKDPAILEDIKNAKSVYHFTQGEYQTVILEIGEELAESFRAVPYFPFQEFLGYEGDRIRITTRIKRPEEIIPDIKMLMPHVRVVDNNEINEIIRRDIKTYLRGT